MNREKVAQHVRDILAEIEGVSPRREGLQDTPERVARAYETWFGGYDVDIGDLVSRSFADGGEHQDQMVFQRGIPVWSHCEHHLAPFFGVAHVAYIPRDKIIGLSKIVRIVDAFARRLQVQERLTTQIADALDDVQLAPYGVGVIVECRHLCMESRGVCAAGTVTTTSALRGNFYELAVKSEFLDLARSAMVIHNA